MNLYKSEDRFGNEGNMLNAENFLRNAKRADTMVVPSEKEINLATVVEEKNSNPLLGIPGHMMAIPSNPNLRSVKEFH